MYVYLWITLIYSTSGDVQILYGILLFASNAKIYAKLYGLYVPEELLMSQTFQRSLLVLRSKAYINKRRHRLKSRLALARKRAYISGHILCSGSTLNFCFNMSFKQGVLLQYLVLLFSWSILQEMHQLCSVSNSFGDFAGREVWSEGSEVCILLLCWVFCELCHFKWSLGKLILFFEVTINHKTFCLSPPWWLKSLQCCNTTYEHSSLKLWIFF